MTEEQTAPVRSSDRRTADDSILNEPLPPAIGERVRTVFELNERPATFGAWMAALRTVFRTELGRPLREDDLCRIEESRHEARVGDETYRFQCVLDAFVLPAFVDDAVSVRSASPISDAAVTARITTESIDANPTTTVVSFGIARDAEAHDEALTPATAYGTLCPYINAFRTAAEYEEWAAGTSGGVTTTVSVPAAVALARELTVDPSSGSKRA